KKRRNELIDVKSSRSNIRFVLFQRHRPVPIASRRGECCEVARQHLLRRNKTGHPRRIGPCFGSLIAREEEKLILLNGTAIVPPYWLRFSESRLEANGFRALKA